MSLTKSKTFPLGILSIYKSVSLRYNSADSLAIQVDLKKNKLKILNWKVMSPSPVTNNFQSLCTCQEGYLEVG